MFPYLIIFPGYRENFGIKKKILSNVLDLIFVKVRANPKPF